MKKILSIALYTALAFTGMGCGSSFEVPAPVASEYRPGGDATVSIQPFPSSMRPAPSLPITLRPAFHAGKALAHQPWVKAPATTTARDGLGPIYNARACLDCHTNGGRGRLPDNGESALFSAIVRISLPGNDALHGVIPDPVYGDQLQTQSVALSHQLRGQALGNDDRDEEAAPEAYVFVDWQIKTFLYPDEERVELRTPVIRITDLGYGKLHPDTLMGLRNAPPIHGVGLLELIDQTLIDAHVDPLDRDNNGISGRINHVWNPVSQKTEPGRFGLKANRPNLSVVTAGAFANDIGISNPLFPGQPCTDKQSACLATISGADAGGVELPANLLDLVVNFTRNLGVPARRGKDDLSVQEGRQLFYRTGCQQCHVPSYVTMDSAAQPHLGKQTIWPYTDLLLHDMGPELADHRSDYEASGSEWRTPPLWGVGLSHATSGSNHLLHDGRARGVEEAILWHGGEAEAIKQAFTRLPKIQRQSLITFVESL